MKEPDITKQLDNDFDRLILTEIHKARAQGYELGSMRATFAALWVIIFMLCAFVCIKMWQEM